MPRGQTWIAAVLATSMLGMPARTQTIDDPALGIEVVTSGLSAPTALAFLGPGDILVTQKNDGLVRRVLNGVLQPGAVLDVAVDSASERGLLGIATDPDFAINRRVFLYYTESSTGADTSGEPAPAGNRIYHYTWNGTALVNPTLVLDLPPGPGPNHDGGPITFGPDGALFAVIGDLNHGGQLQNIPSGSEPDDTSVILRVDTSGRGLRDNPFFDPADPADPMNRYYAYGVRNSFGLAVDPSTGSLWDTENGPNRFDEVNLVVRGLNSGWSAIMGPDALDPEGPGDLWVASGSVYRDPEFSWEFPVAPTTLAFPASPVMGCSLKDDLLAADYVCGQVYRFRLNSARDGLELTSAELQDRVAGNGNSRCLDEMAEIRFGSGFGALTDMELGPDGRLYAVSFFQGSLYRIGPRPGAFPDDDADGVADACDCAPSDAGSFAPPAVVPRLRFPAASPQTMIWDSQTATSGPGTTYAVMTGDLASLRTGGGFGSACTLRGGLTSSEMTDTRPDPPAGSGYYYVVQSENACGPGAFPPACLCSDRSGGAFIRFDIVGESLTVWVTDSAFIDKALQHLASGTHEVPIFGTLADGTDCDPQWTWHTDPEDVVFAGAAIELCDGLPSHVEANKPYWLGTVGSYCPWAAIVVGVEDHR